MTSDRLEDLFVRYWDNALSAEEFAALQRRLTQNPEDREIFQLLTLQAVSAGELSGLGVPAAPVVESEPPAADAALAGSSRRRMLQYGLWGLAAASAGGVATTWLQRPPATTVTPPAEEWPRLPLAVVRGAVRVLAPDGSDLNPKDPVPPGATVLTSGVDASAILSLPRGGTITLAGESVATVAANRLRLILRRGNAIALMRGQPEAAGRFELMTSAAILTHLVEALVTVGHGYRETEVGVREGSVSVSALTGEHIGIVREGDMLTVRVDGQRETRPLPTTPDEYCWTFESPLPEGWAVGERVIGPAGPVVRPDFWFDPYYQTRMWQIRFDHQWARGFCKLYPDSIVRMRYQADRSGDVEVVLCIREDHLPNAKTGCLGCIRPVMATGEESWQWWEATAAELLQHHEAGKFDPPWVNFFTIINAYKADLGLRVAEFRVSRPGGPRGH